MSVRCEKCGRFRPEAVPHLHENVQSAVLQLPSASDHQVKSRPVKRRWWQRRPR